MASRQTHDDVRIAAVEEINIKQVHVETNLIPGGSPAFPIWKGQVLSQHSQAAHVWIDHSITPQSSTHREERSHPCRQFYKDDGVTKGEGEEEGERSEGKGIAHGRRRVCVWLGGGLEQEPRHWLRFA